MKNYSAFSRTHRLTAKAEFKSLFDKSLKVSQKHFLVLYKPNGKLHARLGIIVGKRVVNSSVARNQIKRIVRESFRIHQEKLKGYDIVVMARQQCDTLDKLKLREGIDKLWQKLLAARQNV